MRENRLLTVNVGAGASVRVPRLLEDIVEVIAEERGLTPSTVRSVALLYGLGVLLGGAPIPSTDWEFYDAVQTLRKRAGLGGERYAQED